MNEALAEKVISRHHLEKAFETLSHDMNTSELTTFLSHVFAKRINHIDAGQLRKSIDLDRFVLPGSVSPRVFHAFDTHAFDLLPEKFQIIELSPLAPLGTIAVLAPLDPGVAVMTTRSQEVLSDCTNMLSILAAHQRHNAAGKHRKDVDLCASHRLVRAQLPQLKHHTAHFKILTLVSAGRDTGSFGFELDRLALHITYYVELIRSFEIHRNARIEIVLKEYTDTGIAWDDFSTRAIPASVTWRYERINREDWNYYSPFQFNLNVIIDDQSFNLGDGGITDWTQKLLSDKKERLLISGFGTELFCKLFLV